MKKPELAEYPQMQYFSNYIDLVENKDVIEQLRNQQSVVEALYKNLSPELESYRYAEGKWSTKELLGHMTDAERVFAYRGLCIARGETQPLPGFDENTYFDNANFGGQPLSALLAQYQAVRLSTILLAESLPEEAHIRVGTANGRPVSARALFAVIVGHERHHLNVLAQRYGLQ